MTTNVAWSQMIMYSILYVILIFIVVSIYYMISKVGSEKVGLVFMYLFCIIYGGIRYYVGSDYENYLTNYTYIMYSNFSFLEVLTRSKEIGFNALLFWTARITNYEYGIFWVTSIIIYFLIINAIKKYSSNKIISVFLFFILGYHLFSMNGLRQTISLFIFIHLVYTYYEKKYFKIILLGLVMCSVHSSSILILILFLVVNKIRIKFNKRNYFSMIGLGVVLYFTYNNLIQFAATVIVEIFKFNRYGVYFSAEGNNQSIKMKIAVITISLLYISITGLFLVNRDSLIERNPMLKKILPLLLIGFPFVFIGMRNWPITRMAFYFFQFVIFILPTYFKVVKKRDNGNVKLCIIIIGIIMYSFIYIIFYMDNWYFQYSTYFFK